MYDAIRRYGLPLPVPQHRVVVRGRTRSIDLSYPDRQPIVALEALGFEFHGLRGRHDSDALRGNALRLAGFFVLEFTSAFTDWQIARDVAQALDLPEPAVPRKVLTYHQWRATR